MSNSSKKNGNDSKHWIGFDLGGTKMLATVFDDQFNKLGTDRKKTNGNQGQDAGIKRIISTIHDALKEANLTPDQLAGIGVGCPGPLDLDRGVIIEAPNLGWENLQVSQLLGEEFGCPVVILNDVDAGVYGEYCFGAAQGGHSVLGVFPGTGIGGGFVYQGEIFRGKKSSCMEFGHIQVIPDGPLCGCGRHGCLEAVASRLAISADVAKAAFRGEAPNLLKAVGTDLSLIRSGTLRNAIKKGDLQVERILRDAASHIGTAVASVVNLLAPEYVVLGGGLAEAMPELFVAEVTQAARNRVLPSFVDIFKVVAAKLGDDATVMGAAAWIQHAENDKNEKKSAESKKKSKNNKTQ